jgi:CheY-like chemotaxis protein
MDAETQSHIFEPFFSTKGTKGTGLGLSTVYGIIQQSGGHIAVNSEVGRGTIFKIYLPRIVESGELAAARSAVTPVQKRTQPMETVLIVEDEANLRRMACHYLETQGYKILEAADGAAAMQVCVAHPGPIHLLLTDVIMPGMNGHEVAKRVVSLRPTAKVLYMSGYAENAIGHNGTLDEGTNLLQKPFTLQALKEKVREVLDSQQLSARVDVTGQPPERPIPVRTRIPTFRAQRFNLNLPLRYRLLGEEHWRLGTTENISRSGLLFRAEEMLQPSSQLEINLVLPAEIAGLSAAEVICRGEIVRSVKPENASIQPALAAKILQYHFQHGTQADA